MSSFPEVTSGKIEIPKEEEAGGPGLRAETGSPAGGPLKFVMVHRPTMVRAPFKTRLLRFEWETGNLLLPLIAKNTI
jgi:hypothetical protein